MLFKSILKKTINLILPNRCIFCDKDRFSICKSCFLKLKKINEPYCDICQFVSNSTSIKSYCVNCQNLDFRSNHKIRSCFAYDENSSIVVISLKYLDKMYNVKIISRFIYKMMYYDFQIDLKRHKFFISVPMFKSDLFKRYFNQSAEISRDLFKRFKYEFNETCNMEYVPNLLLKVKKTNRQVELSQKKRMKNLKNAFVINESLMTKMPNKSDIFIVDDVITTMSTVYEVKKQIQDFLDKRNIKDVNIYFYSFLKKI